MTTQRLGRCMAKKVKIARNLRELPVHRRHSAVIADITSSTQTDRGVAIIGAAFVDLVLLEAITTRLASRDAKLIKELFEDRGPLQPFGARIWPGSRGGLALRYRHHTISASCPWPSADRVQLNHALRFKVTP
jgi:hypothetical protein